MPDPTPTLRQLRYLVALADCGHFRRAAERCGVSQPSLSAQIQALEDLLGTRLFERGRGPALLTPVGRDVATRAREVLAGAQGIVEAVAASRKDLVGTIRLGVKPTLGPYLLPHVVGRLHAAHPGLNLYIRESPPREMELELAQGAHDVVLTRLPVTSGDLVTERLFREPLVLALSADHPLAAEETVPLERLSGQTMLSLGPRYHLHDLITDLCRECGAEVSREYEGTSLDALRQMVGMGMGVTLLPALYVRSEISGRSGEVVVRRLTARPIMRSVGLAWRRRSGRERDYRRIAELIRRVARDSFPELVVDG